MHRFGHVLLAVGAVLAGAVAIAPAASATSNVSVPCGGSTSALADAIRSVNTAGGGTITLAPHCTFPAIEDNTTDGGNAYPAITTPITINGQQSKVIPNVGGIRAFDIGSGGTLSLFDLDIHAFSNDTLGGAGLWTHAGATANLTRVAVENNQTAGNGAGIRNNGTTNITDSLISQNLALGTSSVGAGISNGQGTVNITRSTIVYNHAVNTAGGLWAYSTTNVVGSIIAANRGDHGSADCGQAVSDNGYNIGSDNSCGLSGTSLQGVDPGVVAVPELNGNYLPSAGLPPVVGGSPNPAVDAIPAGSALCTGSDERSIARPQGSGCDIGSFEVGPSHVAVSGATSITSGQRFYAHLTVSDAGALAGPQVPTGKVTLSLGATVLRTGALDSAGTAVLSTTALTVGQHTVTLSYAGDSVYRPSSTSLAVVVGTQTDGYAGWTAQFPDGRGSASAVVRACGAGGPSSAYYTGIFSTGDPNHFGAFLFCSNDGALFAGVQDGTSLSDSIDVSPGDRVRTTVAENATDVRLSVADLTTGESTSLMVADPRPAFTIGVAFNSPPDALFAPVRFSAAMIDGYPLGFDPATPSNAVAGVLHAQTQPIGASGQTFSVTSK